MPTLPYQSHVKGDASQVDSFEKLERLSLPSNLTAKSVLDIGCNEGFFCKQALLRGASKVVGIDADARVIEKARELYKDTRLSFLNQDWQTLPLGTYDLILWTSAMHYELNPLKVFKNIAAALNPSGLFVLECGVVEQPVKQMTRVIRHDGAHWYPSEPLLYALFDAAGLAYRRTRGQKLTGTDPIPRSVFHCTLRRPTVLLVSGESQNGKSYLAHAFNTSVSQVISLDWFLSRIAYAKHSHTAFETFVQKNINADNLRLLYESIDHHQFTNEYIKQLTKGISSADNLVVIEGFMTDVQVKALTRELAPTCNVWHASRSVAG